MNLLYGKPDEWLDPHLLETTTKKKQKKHNNNNNNKKKLEPVDFVPRVTHGMIYRFYTKQNLE